MARKLPTLIICFKDNSSHGATYVTYELIVLTVLVVGDCRPGVIGARGIQNDTFSKL